MNKLIVISGCSGGGKSTLISQLEKQGYAVVPEVGREIVKEGLTPQQNPQAFCELLIKKSLIAFTKATTMPAAKEMVFLDRSLLEGISYYQSLNLADSHQYDHLLDQYRYASTVFMMPPWQQIFIQDDERQHSFDDAVSEYERLMECYPRFGYRMIEVPKFSVEDRVQFILSAI